MLIHTHILTHTHTHTRILCVRAREKQMKKNKQVLQNLWAAFRTDALQAEASECLKYNDTKTPPFAWGAGDLVRPSLVVIRYTGL